jgi:hypothetical protein
VELHKDVVLSLDDWIQVMEYDLELKDGPTWLSRPVTSGKDGVW